MSEEIRREFLSDWLNSASKEEILEKLIQNDDRAKLIDKLQKENKKKDKRIICLKEYNKDIKKDLKEVYDEIKNSNVFEEEEHFKAYVLRTLEDIL